MLHTIINYCKTVFHTAVQRAKHSALLYLQSIDNHMQHKSKRMEADARRYHANSNICIWDLDREA